MEMTFAATSWGRVIEQAEEELQILEAQHPKMYKSLKADLHSFILAAKSQHLLLQNDMQIHSSTCTSTVSSQASSSSKRKTASCMNGYFHENGVKRRKTDGDRVDVVLQRAHTCLQKIRDLKSYFC